MEIVALPQGFGAEVLGFDTACGRAETEVAQLRNAFDNHGLLLFRNCGRLAPERQTEIAGWFGTPGADTGSGEQAWTFMDNADEQGRALLPFHSDITYMPHPLEGISLHVLQLPECGTSTTFISTLAAWNSLDSEMRRRLGRLKARHYLNSRESLSLRRDLEYWHPIALRHPRTGRRLLFVTEYHVDRIEGLSEAEGAAILGELFAHLYAPLRRYEHVWRHGDLVVWDNLVIQHARTRVASPSEGPRVLQRVSFGEHSFAEQFANLANEAATDSATAAPLCGT